MAEIKDKLNEVKNTISNQDEATKVMSIIMEITEGYEDKLMEIEKRQTMLEERTAEIIEMLKGLEEELEAALIEDFEAECPYCGETIPFQIPEEGKDFECPKCHNTIELEMMFDGCDCGCDCEDCNHDDCDCDCDDCDCDCEDEDEE